MKIKKRYISFIAIVFVIIGSMMYCHNDNNIWTVSFSNVFNDILKETEVVEVVEAKTDDILNLRSWSQKYINKGIDRDKRFGITSKKITFDKKYLTWKGGKKLSTKELESIVRNTFKIMPHIRTTTDTVALVVETAITESDGGRIITNKFGDHGVFQIKVRTSQDLLKWLKYEHKDIHAAIMSMRNASLSEKDNLQKNIPYACAICITEYWRKAGSQYHMHIASLEERGKMWKSVYNTHKGHGTVADYINRVTKYDTITVAYKEK